MTVQSTSVCVLLAAVPWSSLVYFVGKFSSFDCLRYSYSGIADYVGQLAVSTDCFIRFYYFIRAIFSTSVAGYSKQLGKPTRLTLSYAACIA